MTKRKQIEFCLNSKLIKAEIPADLTAEELVGVLEDTTRTAVVGVEYAIPPDQFDTPIAEVRLVDPEQIMAITTSLADQRRIVFDLSK